MAGGPLLIYEFVSEAKEHLANVGDDLLALERYKGDSSRYRIDRLFRAVHSIKGGAGFFGCRVIEELAHAMENVLDYSREQSAAPNNQVIDALLAGNDRIAALLDDVERSNEADIAALLSRLRELLPDHKNASAAQSASPPLQDARTSDVLLPTPVLADRPDSEAYVYGLTIDLRACEREQGLGPGEVLRRLQEAGTILNARLDVPEEDLDSGLSKGDVSYQAMISSALPMDEFTVAFGLPVARIEVVEEPPSARPSSPDQGRGQEISTQRGETPIQRGASAQRGPQEESARPADRGGTIRIPVPLVDRLMTLAGELVLVRNQATRTVDSRDAHLRPLVQRLDAVTGELQDAVMRTRMQPVGNLFGKFPRMVRDLAKQMGKQIELEIRGTEVELDKTILEALSDPLTHLIRNSCDHGIEPPQTREGQGKSAQGRIMLSARHLGDQIHIEVRDDGKGIDPQAIKRKALEQGLRSSAELSRFSDRELLGLILLPGFSTATAVTDLSGRGVGMDVVKTNLDRLGGVLEIDSEAGRGAVFSLRLPLTLAIIPCLIVTAGGERYAIPQKDLEELVFLQPGQSRTRIEYAFDQEVVRLRDRLVPLVRLSEVLQRREPFTPETRADILRTHRNQGSDQGTPDRLVLGPTEKNGKERDETGVSAPTYFAVVRAGSQRFGIVVDSIMTTEEIVVKPMHSAMRSLGCFAGATIMGDGRVALILSIEGVARHAGVRFDGGADVLASARGADQGPEAQTVLLFQYGPRERFAVPLAMVRRIEMVHMSQVERIGDQEFVTVDDVSTRILRLDRFLSVSSFEDRDPMFLLLPRNVGHPFGVFLSAILDTETLPVHLSPDSFQADGVLGTAIIRGQMTLFPDVYRLGEMLDPEGRLKPSLSAPGRKRRVLLVEDTQFFREVVKGYLEADGLEVTTAKNGLEGLEKLDAVRFDLIVSDIEMPEMDGWAFARAARQRPDARELPLLALTTLSSDNDRAKAAECGFNRYELKLDRERFLGAVKELLGEGN
jgi:two-component system chemotaxis sensor kinase CheA